MDNRVYYEPLPNELSNIEIQLIHSGLMIPYEETIQKMAREIRKWRGVPYPDSV
jgi:hypothetical protein